MTGALPPRPEATRAWPLYRAMVGLGLLCGLLIVGVFLGTAPVIERKQAAALERAIFQVLPAARSSRAFDFSPEGGFAPAGPGPGDHERVYAGYAADGQLVGVAVEASGMGYQDVIRVLYGYSFTEDAIVGIQVLESRETPGLGDRIETDPGFLANFRRLDVSLRADGSGLAHPIEVVKHGTKRHPWQVDGITGASISSAAVATLLRESTERWVPRIRAHLDQLRAEGPA